MPDIPSLGAIGLNVVPTLNPAAFLSTARKAITDAVGELGAASDLALTQRFAARGQALSAAGGALTRLSAPVVAFGAAAVVSSEQYDQATRVIQQRTGATGVELAKLRASFQHVADGSGASFAQIADTESQLVQQLNLSGKPLEDRTKQFLALQRVTGDSAPTIKQVTDAMAAFSIPTAKQGVALDHLFVAAQKTGVPLNQLIQQITTGGPQLRAFGLDLDSSAAFVGALGKEGVPATQVLTALRTSLKKLPEGADANKFLTETITKIKELSDAGRTGAARSLAIDTFGSRGGAALLDFAKRGTGDFEKLKEQIAGGDNAINKVAKDTLPLITQFKQVKNQIELALRPVGEAIIPKIEAGLKAVTFLAKGFRLPVNGPLVGDAVVLVALSGPALKLAGAIYRVGAGFSAAATSAKVYVASVSAADGASATASASVGSLGGALSTVTIAAAAGYGAFKLTTTGLEALESAVNGAPPKVDALTKSLREYLKTGKSGGEAATSLAKLKTELNQLGSDNLITRLGLDKSAPIAGPDDAINALIHGIGERFKTDKAKAQIDSLDASLAALVKDNPDNIGKITKQLQALGLSADAYNQLISMLVLYRGAVHDASTAVDDNKKKHDQLILTSAALSLRLGRTLRDWRDQAKGIKEVDLAAQKLQGTELASERANNAVSDALTEQTRAGEDLVTAKQNLANLTTGYAPDSEKARQAASDEASAVTDLADKIQSLEDAKRSEASAEADYTKVVQDGIKKQRELAEAVTSSHNAVIDSQEALDKLIAQGADHHEIEKARRDLGEKQSSEQDALTNQRQGPAEQAKADSDAAQKVADAQRGVTKALADVDQARAKAADSQRILDLVLHGGSGTADELASAQRGVEDATKRVRDANLAVPEAVLNAADAQRKLNDQMILGKLYIDAAATSLGVYASIAAAIDAGNYGQGAAAAAAGIGSAVRGAAGGGGSGPPGNIADAIAHHSSGGGGGLPGNIHDAIHQNSTAGAKGDPVVNAINDLAVITAAGVVANKATAKAVKKKGPMGSVDHALSAMGLGL